MAIRAELRGEHGQGVCEVRPRAVVGRALIPSVVFYCIKMGIGRDYNRNSVGMGILLVGQSHYDGKGWRRLHYEGEGWCGDCIMKGKVGAAIAL